jgi:hypothetical protein
VKIRIVLDVLDEEDQDPDDSSGLTEGAYLRLTDAISNAGFDIDSGPDVEST